MLRLWLQSGSGGGADRKAAMLRMGLRVTRHPRMGAAEELKVTLGELAENRRLIEKRGVEA